MRDWREIEKPAILTGKDENGNRFLSQFLKDYNEIFQPQEINAGCQRCLDEYYTKTIKYLNTMQDKKNESGYVLKPKYEGIPLEFGSQTFVNNRNITREHGDKLLKGHPRGADLFEVVPKKQEKAAAKDLTDHTRKELDAIAAKKGIDSNEYSTKEDLAKAIAEYKPE